MITKELCYFQESCKKFKEGTCVDLFCIRLFKLDQLYKNALLTPAQSLPIKLYVDADGTDKDKYIQLSTIEKNIKSFVTEGKNLYIHSAICGNGKTAWSLKLIQAYLNKIWPESSGCRALFINVPRFFLALKDSISSQNDYIDHIKANVLEADLVVWDEVGVKALTPYEHEHLLNFINTRLDCGKSNIYTSNLQPAELKEKIGDRLYSRVVNLSEEIVFNGQDKRGIKVVR